MLKLLKPLPRKLVVACSGGVDSMAVLDFLGRNHDVTAAFYHHGTTTSDTAIRTVAQYCTDKRIPLLLGHLTASRPRGLSLEEWWRNSRYEFLDGLGSSLGPIVTGHHLDDGVETYLWSAMHGKPKLIPYCRGNVVRPFLTTRKSALRDWAMRHGVVWSDDESNNDVHYTRNYVRHTLLPHALHINPGIHKTVKRMVENQNKTCDNAEPSKHKHKEKQHG